MKVVILLFLGACSVATVRAQSQSGGFDITGNKNCRSEECLLNVVTENPLNPSAEAATECCVYFLSGCCTPIENEFLHKMFIVAITGGVVLFVIILGCIGLCICCCACCGMLCFGDSGRRLHPITPPQYQPLDPSVTNIQVANVSTVTTHPY